MNSDIFIIYGEKSYNPTSVTTITVLEVSHFAHLHFVRRFFQWRRRPHLHHALQHWRRREPRSRNGQRVFDDLNAVTPQKELIHKNHWTLLMKNCWLCILGGVASQNKQSVLKSVILRVALNDLYMLKFHFFDCGQYWPAPHFIWFKLIQSRSQDADLYL